MPASASTSEPPRTSTSVPAWLALVLGAWSGMHALHLLLPIPTQGRPLLALTWWTCAKVCAWLLPTVLFTLRHAGRAWARWLGLDNLRGIGAAVALSAAWIAFQIVGLWLQLPLFKAPDSGLPWHAFVGALLIAPLFEELMFRGFMLRALRERGYSHLAVVVLTALAFAALHLPGWFVHRGLDAGIAGSFVSIAAFGLLLGELGWRTPSLWAPVLLHLANNVWSTGVLR